VIVAELQPGSFTCRSACRAGFRCGRSPARPGAKTGRDRKEDTSGTHRPFDGESDPEPEMTPKN